MANVKISGLTAETTVAADMLFEGEKSNGDSFKMTRANLFAGVPLIDGGADQTPAELTAIARADIDQDDDLILVWDNSAGELKKIDYQDLYDLEAVTPSTDFTINAATRPGVFIAPSGGSTCTVAAMRVGQSVLVVNVSGGSYSFSASGVTIVGDTSVGDDKVATVFARTATVIHITAES